jgi:hypothetical protein
MASTDLRPDEAARLEYRDVVIAEDHGTGETILEIEVRGNAVSATVKPPQAP